MKKILSFGASNSINSINKKFAHYTSSLLTDLKITNVDLNDFEVPLFGVDLEKEIGSPENAQKFNDLIESHDALIISLAEHNSNLTAVFKNLTDWVSRLEGDTWKGKKMFLLSTSPGGRGGSGALNIALNNFPYRGANISAHFSLPKFFENFSASEGILDKDLRTKFLEQLEIFRKSILD